MPTEIVLAVIVLLLPLLAFAIQIFVGKRLPRGGDWVSLSAIFAGLGISIYLFVTRMLAGGDPHLAYHWSVRWIELGPFAIDVGINLDNMCMVMLMVVTVVSSLVHLYSVGYMKGDVRYSRYFAFLSLFSFSMLELVLADSLILIYVGWELVGLCSYLLIGFWYEKDSAANAGKKAFIVNRIGDAGFFIGIMIVLAYTGTTTLSGVFDAVGAGKLSGSMLTIACLCLFCGAIGKSAQFPLHVWLPDAMEGPTPVSALIHAATMVAAGVYMTARLFPMLTPDASVIIALFGGFTAFLAATIAVAQNDIKRVLAYSTVSQLGYMILGIGVGSYTAGFFHLGTHAMFKACLFLCSGSVIHAMHHALHHIHDHATEPQDMRNMGGLKTKLPVTYWTMLVATLALAGIPLTAGFLSKDAILGGVLHFAMEHPGWFILPVFGFGAAMLTAFYMFRLIFLTFFGKFRSAEGAFHHVNESPKVMTVPLVILSTLSVFIFYSPNPISAESGWFAKLLPAPAKVVQAPIPVHGEVHVEVAESHAVSHSGAAGAHDSSHSAHYIAMVISILVALTGIYVAYQTYYRWKISAAAWQKRLGVIARGMQRKWWFDEVYHATVVALSLLISRLFAAFDKYVIDGFLDGTAKVTAIYSTIQGWFDDHVVDGLVNFTAWVTDQFGAVTRRFQTGRYQNYVWLTAAVVVLVLLWQMI
ncbi:MAG: NADH-quinone oxidoreductase subunit L [Calditrichaeota bacterium]|nr:NADH-quinone oxidoreductase subunit L [Calditrichota bacterium]